MLKTSSFKKLAAVAAIASVIGANSAFAACSTAGCAEVNPAIQLKLFPSLAISAGTPLNLGKLVIPGTGTQFVDLTTANSTAASTISIVGGVAAGSHVLSTAASGALLAGAEVNIKITGVNTISGVTLNELRLASTGGFAGSCTATNIATGCTIATSGVSASTITLAVGAKVTVANTATPATYNSSSTLGYTILAEYQ